jgi:regulator of protease activity HflC (stomatin/prohibitin superfamily)
MRFIGLKLWTVYFIVVAVIGLTILTLLSAFLVPFSWALIIALLAVAAILSHALIGRKGDQEGQRKGFYIVPNKYELVVEELGEYIGRTLGPGYYFIFPYFNFIFIKGEVYIGDDERDLFDREGDNRVDFADGAAADIDAKVYFQVIDPEKACYNIASVEDAVIDKVESSLRAFVGSNTLDYVNKNKGKIVLFSEKDERDSLCTKDLLERIKEEWGVEVKSLTITDLELSEEDIRSRRQIMEAKISAEIAVEEAKREVTLAEGRREATKLDGQGLADKVEAMVEKGASREAVFAFLEQEIKWSNLGDKAVIIDDGQGMAGIIAKLKALGSSLS